MAASGNSGRWCVLAAAVLWSTSGLFAKSPLFADWPEHVRGPLLAFWRALFGGLAVLPWIRRPRWRPALLPMAIAFSGMSVCFMQAMSVSTAANAIWLQSTAPAWVFAFSVLVLREPIDRANLVMFAFGLAGVALILCWEIPGGESGHGDSWGVAFGLAAGLLYAGVVVSLRWLRGEDAAWLVAINQLSSAALLAPYVVTTGIRPDGAQVVWMALFGVFQMGLPYILFARGLRSVSQHEGAGIALVEPCLVPVWVALAWNEWPRWWTVCGAALILCGLVARYAGNRRESGPGSPPAGSAF